MTSNPETTKIIASSDDTATLSVKQEGQRVRFEICSYVHGLGPASVAPLAFCYLTNARLGLLIRALDDIRSRIKASHE